MTWSTSSSTARGYGAAWRKVRQFVLERDCYLCQCPRCKASGRVTPASEVDHIVSKAEAKRKGWTQQQTDDPSNLRAIAHACHVRVTAEQQGHKPKRRVGLDGFPIDD